VTGTGDRNRTSPVLWRVMRQAGKGVGSPDGAIRGAHPA
jgi:hypothetical protein